MPPLTSQPTTTVALQSPDRSRGKGDNLFCAIVLRIEVGGGCTVPIEFRVDTGCSRPMIPLALAKSYGLPVPKKAATRFVSFNTAAGATRREVLDGRLRVWWDAGRHGEPFDWPVMFLMDAPATSYPLLGLGGVIRDCRWVFDGRPEPDAEFGTATFTDMRFDT